MEKNYNNFVFIKLFYFRDKNKKIPAEGARIYLLDEKDERLLGTTNQLGAFSFSTKTKGRVNIKITLPSFANCYANLFIKEDEENVFLLRLEPINKKYKNQILRYYSNGSNLGISPSE